MAGVFVLLLVLGAVLSLWQAVRATLAEQMARQEQDKAVVEKNRADAEALEATQQKQQA